MESQGKKSHGDLRRLYFPQTLLKGFVVMATKGGVAGVGGGAEGAPAGNEEEKLEMETDYRDLLLELKEAVQVTGRQHHL